MRAPIERLGAGAYALRLRSEERSLLRRLSLELRSLLEDAPTDPSLARLTPPAYVDDPEAQAEYRDLVASDLSDGRERALATLAETAGRDVIGSAELDAWLRALNDLRLVLGTRLDVREDTFDAPLDPREPGAHERAVYAYLSWLQEHAVAAAADDLSRG